MDPFTPRPVGGATPTLSLTKNQYMAGVPEYREKYPGIAALDHYQHPYRDEHNLSYKIGQNVLRPMITGQSPFIQKFNAPGSGALWGAAGGGLLGLLGHLGLGAANLTGFSGRRSPGVLPAILMGALAGGVAGGGLGAMRNNSYYSPMYLKTASTKEAFYRGGHLGRGGRMSTSEQVLEMIRNDYRVPYQMKMDAMAQVPRMSEHELRRLLAMAGGGGAGVIVNYLLKGRRPILSAAGGAALGYLANKLF